MANPQKENGNTQIANEILEALCKKRISGQSMQILLFIIRKTYGWHKKEDQISLSQFCLGTGLDKPHIVRNIRKLTTQNMVISQKGNAKGNKYRFNKDFDTWKSFPEKATIAQKGNSSLPKKAHTKETITKETNIYIAKFKKINPTYEIIYKNTTERGALERLIKRFGWPEIEAKIDFLAVHKNDKYCPQAFTPYYMEKKWPQLEKFILEKTREEREYRAQSSLVKRPVDPEGLKRIAEMKKGLSFKMPEENEED